MIRVMLTIVINLKVIIFSYFQERKCFCCVCNTRVRYFLPYKGGATCAPSVVNRKKIVGSNLDKFLCVKCKSSDRERHLFMYFSELNVWEKMVGAVILHLAPEKNLRKKICSLSPKEYVAGDLYPDSEDVTKIDVEDIQFSECYFDIVIANHILEHVQNDRSALEEIYRVLKNGGFAVLQTPFSAVEYTTIEGDTGSNTKNEELYAQADHVRLYGLDIISRFESVGFINMSRKHSDYFPVSDVDDFGVNVEEPFMCFRKAI